MENELKLNNTAIKSNALSKENLWVVIPVVLLLGLVATLIYNHHAEFSWNGFLQGFDENLLAFFLIGVFAQLVDGALGMGYGATSTSFLLAYGVSPVLSSTAVHVSEMFTTGASALSHHRFGNINKKLITMEEPKTQYITVLAPYLSDKYPPNALITPDGKLNIVANIPPITREV